MSKEPAPASLGEAGEKLWTSVVAGYTLRPDELAVLESACKMADRISFLELAWEAAGFPVQTRGSMGQEVIHPLFSEQKTLAAAMAALLGKLTLPDVAVGTPVNQNRAAGQSRWAAAHGSR